MTKVTSVTSAGRERGTGGREGKLTRHKNHKFISRNETQSYFKEFHGFFFIILIGLFSHDETEVT